MFGDEERCYHAGVGAISDPVQVGSRLEPVLQLGHVVAGCEDDVVEWLDLLEDGDQVILDGWCSEVDG